MHCAGRQTTDVVREQQEELVGSSQPLLHRGWISEQGGPTQDYLQDAKIPLRIKSCYKPTEQCPLGCGQLDTQENLLQCLSIKMSSFDVMTNKDCQYSDIFTNDPEKMKAATLLFDKAIRTREMLLEDK